MKPIKTTLLAAALTLAFSSAYAAEPDHKTDTATYKTVTLKSAADYKAAAALCTGSGNEKSACIEEAKVARAHADLDAVTQHNNTLKARTAAHIALANAEQSLAKVRCVVMSGADKDGCMANAKSVHTAALADAKADRDTRVATTAAAAGVDGKGLIANTQTREPVKAAAVDKCAKIAGQPSTGCLVDNKDRSVANAAANTRDAAATAGQKTERVAETAAEKTRNAAAVVADKTGRAVDRVAGRTEAATDRAAARTERAGERMADKTGDAAHRSGKVVADSVITTKVKADLFKEPELSAMAIHVETEKGVVMLSGFVDNKADADKAVRLAKSVEGVSQVKSAIKVK